MSRERGNWQTHLRSRRRNLGDFGDDLNDQLLPDQYGVSCAPTLSTPQKRHRRGSERRRYALSRAMSSAMRLAETVAGVAYGAGVAVNG